MDVSRPAGFAVQGSPNPPATSRSDLQPRVASAVPLVRPRRAEHDPAMGRGPSRHRRPIQTHEPSVGGPEVAPQAGPLLDPATRLDPVAGRQSVSAMDPSIGTRAAARQRRRTAPPFRAAQRSGRFRGPLQVSPTGVASSEPYGGGDSRWRNSRCRWCAATIVPGPSRGPARRRHPLRCGSAALPWPSGWCHGPDGTCRPRSPG